MKKRSLDKEEELAILDRFEDRQPLCIGNKNKPPAMQVCPQIALASSKNLLGI